MTTGAAESARRAVPASLQHGLAARRFTPTPRSTSTTFAPAPPSPSRPRPFRWDASCIVVAYPNTKAASHGTADDREVHRRPRRNRGGGHGDLLPGEPC